MAPRRGVRAGCWRPVKWLALLGCSLGVHLGITLVLAMIPLGEFGPDWHTDSPAFFERNSVVDFLRDHPWSLAIALSWSALCGLIAWLQRGQENRYDGLALLACALAFTGAHFTFFGCDITVMHGGDYRPIGVLQIAVSLLSASGAFGLVSLAQLLWTRSRRRGRALALFCLVWGPWFAWAVDSMVLRPRCPKPAPPGWELPVVKRAWSNHYYHLRSDREPVVDVSVDREGNVTVDGVARWRPAGGESDEALHQALVTAAARMPVDPDLPGPPYRDGPLYLKADARASCADVLRIFEHCAEQDVRIWKFTIHVSRGPYLQKGMCDTYRLIMYSGRGERAGTPPPGGVLDLLLAAGTPDTAGVRYRYLGAETTDAAEVLDHMAGFLGESGDELYRIQMRAAPSLRWGEAIEAAFRLHEALLLAKGQDPHPGEFASFELLRE